MLVLMPVFCRSSSKTAFPLVSAPDFFPRNYIAGSISPPKYCRDRSTSFAISATAL